MPDEPSVTTPGGSTPDRPGASTPGDETIAIPATDKASAAIEPDEATVALPATPPADEDTVAMPAEKAPVATPADEATVTLTATPATGEATAATPADEATVTQSATPPADEAGEATVATPADEATVTLSATPPADEATVAMPAGKASVATPADEATVTLSATPPADEATTAMPAGEATTAMPAGDATVAMPAGGPPDEATVTLPADTAPDESTVMIASGAVADKPGTATLRGRTAPEEATTWLPAGLGTTVTPTGRPAGTGPSFLTRRRLLLGLSGVAGATLAGAAAVAVHSATSGSGDSPAKPVSGRPAVVTSRTPESTTVTASPVPVQRRPISTLAEYAKASGAPAFPADAIALTIDDGPHPVWTPKILRLLDQYQVPAMFCMIGNQVLGHEEVAQMVTTAGHQLANHTWSHPTKLGTKPKTVHEKEIRKAQTKISRTTGYTPKLFRSPGGDWSPQLLRNVAQAGLLPLDWSNDPRDWTQPGVAKIENRMLAARPGQILLCHDGGGDRSQTYKALSVVIPALKARGLQFVAL